MDARDDVRGTIWVGGNSGGRARITILEDRVLARGTHGALAGGDARHNARQGNARRPDRIFCPNYY